MEELVRFIESVGGDAELEEALVGAADEAEVARIAAGRGFEVTADDLEKGVEVARGVLAEAEADAPFSEEQLQTMAGRLGLILFVVRMLGLKKHERF